MKKMPKAPKPSDMSCKRLMITAAIAIALIVAIVLYVQYKIF